DINNPGQAVAGWPPVLSSAVSTPPMIVGTGSGALVLVGCDNGRVYALDLVGSVRDSTTLALGGGIRGRLAAAQPPANPIAPVGTIAMVAAGSANGSVGVWALPQGIGAMTSLAAWPQRLVSYSGFAPDFLWIDFDGAGAAGGNPSGCTPNLPELVVHDRNRL